MCTADPTIYLFIHSFIHHDLPLSYRLQYMTSKVTDRTIQQYNFFQSTHIMHGIPTIDQVKMGGYEDSRWVHCLQTILPISAATGGYVHRSDLLSSRLLGFWIIECVLTQSTLLLIGFWGISPLRSKSSCISAMVRAVRTSLISLTYGIVNGWMDEWNDGDWKEKITIDKTIDK